MENAPVIGFKIASEEAVKAYEDQMDSLRSIRDTVKTILSSTSIIFALISALQTVRTWPDKLPLAYSMVGISTLILFALLIFLSVQVLVPKVLSYPIKKTEWKAYATDLMGKEDIEVYKVLTALYIDSITLNEPILSSLSMKTRWSGVLMIAVVAGLIVLTLL